MNLRFLCPGSLAAAALLGTGCGEHDHAASGGTHRHGSVHGGVAVELGEHQFQLDVLAEPVGGTVQVWVMDGHMENFVRTAMPAIELQVTTAGQTRAISLGAQSNAATGERLGDTSHFAGQEDWMRGVTGFTATVSRVEIKGGVFRDVRFSYTGRP